MSDLSQLVTETISRAAKSTAIPQTPLAEQLASALRWHGENARVEAVSASGLSIHIARGLVSEQPAIVFASNGGKPAADLVTPAALYAYHASVEWGIATDLTSAIIFNSHWLRQGSWFHLPPVYWEKLSYQSSLLEAVTPRGLINGELDKMIPEVLEPDKLLHPVDDALVACLDEWRAETLRFTRRTEHVDEHLQLLFAQFFILRAVEDRNLCPDIPSLSSIIVNGEEADFDLLTRLFRNARERIQSELFDEIAFSDIPPFVIAGIINDLYHARHLPGNRTRYNFAWIDADVLGSAYQKYLSTVIAPAGLPSPQLRLWQQPTREVDRVSVRKASGVYYTPSFLSQYLTERCLDECHHKQPLSDHLPKILDLSCGSGSFLVAAADSIIKRLRQLDNKRNWGRTLVDQQCITGIDIDLKAITIARLSLWLRLAEEPDALPLPQLESRIICADSLSDEAWTDIPDNYDVIVGNPPFIATGQVHTRFELAKRYATAQGRFDYSYLFIEAAVKRLVEGGVLGMVIPNRLFTNRDAFIVRDIITRSLDLLTVVNFGSNMLFPGASSYIGTILGRKQTDGGRAISLRYVDVRELPVQFPSNTLFAADQAEGPFRTRYARAFDTPHPRGAHPWLFLSPATRMARMRLEEQSEQLGSLAGIYQGISTGANDVFVVDLDGPATGSVARIRNGLGDTHLVEVEMLRPVIFGASIKRYDLVRPKQYLIYPYLRGEAVPPIEMERFFPHTHTYLRAYRSMLSERSSLTPGRHWYELIRKRDEDWLRSPKLLIRDLALEPSFALDDTGSTFLVKGTAVVPSDEQLLLPLLGYLNSSLVKQYLSMQNTTFRASFQKYEPQHFETVPVINDVVERGSLRDQLSSLAEQVISAKMQGDSETQEQFERQIDSLLFDHLEVDARIFD